MRLLVVYVFSRLLIWAAALGLFYLVAGKWGLVAGLVLFIIAQVIEA